MSAWKSLASAFKDAVGEALDQKLASRHQPPRTSRRERTRMRPRSSSRQAPPPTEDYPGDFSGPLRMAYEPHPGDLPDPGEVVWTWVPYEEDHRKGKDRPVLLIGRDEPWLLGLPLTSKDHDRDMAQEAGQGRYWVDVGSGSWDTRRRPSEARVDRIVRVSPDKVRRIGDKVDAEVFDRVALGVRRHRDS